VDLRAILQTAIRLSESSWQSLKVEVRTELQPELPPVMGDSNQLLQAFVHVLNQAMSAAGQLGIRVLTVEAEHRNGFAVISILGNAIHNSALPAVGRQAAEGTVTDPFANGWGLKACQGILTQYQGKISWEQGESTGIAIHLELPVLLPVRERSAATGAKWQPQSFA
jgi:C4-dicarboxylate-specific signal transduction histidine kinase